MAEAGTSYGAPSDSQRSQDRSEEGGMAVKAPAAGAGTCFMCQRPVCNEEPPSLEGLVSDCCCLVCVRDGGSVSVNIGIFWGIGKNITDPPSLVCVLCGIR